MQQRNFFLTLLMATVMMVFSPQITRAVVETVTVGEGPSEIGRASCRERV